MSRARDLGSSINSITAGKNFIINGGMDVWQRGTSITNGYPIYGADRWLNYGNGNGVMSRQPVSDTTNLPGIQYCLRLQRTSGSTSTNSLYMSQSIETINSIPLAGKTVTLSYYARRGANFSGTSFNISNMLVVETVSGTGTDQNCVAGFTGGTNPAGGVSYQVITSTWTRYSFTFVVPSSSTQLGFNFFFAPTGTAGANDYFEITGIQLELGSSATTFSRAGGDIQGELAKCQRYYWRTSTGGTYKGFGFGMGFSTTQARCMIQFPQTMRTTPAGVEGGGVIAVMDSVTGYLSTGISIDGNVMTPQSAYVNVSVASGLTQYRPYFLYSMADANAYIGFSAEL
jgi:hypothetical protein